MPDSVSCADTRLDAKDALAGALARAGLAADIRAVHPMADTGLAHTHVWLERDTIDWVARLPKQSQMGLPAEENLAYQAACFARAGPSGHTPALHGVLPPAPELPRGGLLVSAVRGRPARLPDDLPAIAEALAAIHGLEVPTEADRAPLRSPADPWRAMREEVARQAEWLAHAGLSRQARARIEEELAALPERLPPGPGTAPRLISFDAHPGNFLVTDSGRAVLVDLEKCRYGLPGFDLAHATLYTSTTWDLHSRAVLTLEEVADFYRQWRSTAGLAGDTLSLLACRRAMWLWSLTWCAKWRAQHRRERDAAAGGEDWSAELSDDALVAHVRERVDHYLSPEVIARVKDELLDLRLALGD
ncbi:aminoglycoside phosphotransferase family protein [Halomonas mongoliensis]|uniref:Aminoglycoside phosphotransferase family protein n=1 Tax=Halomonas mongoliensis TaxID=321265 RepID=A0ABU1GHJ4_9GAMM|nr:aminoglycoside phosphotransferase family protein [Halomonas mongoliensis]MDR5891310.1 aminoglycoside phosphotransferase family protein [Halomonas mongoliensis]